MNVEQKDTLSEMQKKVNEFAKFELNYDMSKLTDKQKQMLPLFFEAAKIMDDIFWTQAYGNKQELLASIDDEATKKFVQINYGPWERLNGNKSFIDKFGKKPAGANFYPQDMTEKEYKELKDKTKSSLYTLIKRKEDGSLEVVPYHIAYKEKIEKVSQLLKKASELAENPGLKKYLELRSKALLNDDYFASDMAWMDMKTNTLDFVVGPIENYEDALYGSKAAHEAYILIKDQVWSKKLEKYAAMLPEMQKSLPVDPKYKKETPGSNSDLGAYDVLFYAGDCNAGSKTIAINLPNDEKVQLKKGSRRLQLKNAMRAKFDKILLPISKVLIADDQQKHITYDAFFSNTMFHEVAHGLGIKNTIDGKSTAREALKEVYSAIEEGKADILGLYLVTKLHEKGELGNADLMDNYVTFMAGIFRSVRFGVSSSHGKANMIRFYYFQEKDAFTKDPKTGKYSINFEKMKEAMNALSADILKLQGDGDYEGAKKLIAEKGIIKEELQKDLDLISEKGIPKDIIFIQGKEVIGL